MNGNDLDNMAKRYKEEMMRLYQRRGSAAQTDTSARTAAAERNGGIMGRGAGMSGNPIQSTAPSASAVAKSNVMRNENVTNPNPQSRNSDLQPSGNNAAQRTGAPYFGMSGNMRPHGNSGSPPNSRPDAHVTCECRFPSAESIINSIANTPMTLPLTPEDNPTPIPEADTSLIQPRTDADADDNGRDVKLRSIIINTSVEDPQYSVPSRSEEASEIMPDFALPADLPADSGETIPRTASFTPSRTWISLTGDNSWGFLQVEVYTSGGDFPLQGAMVIVKKLVSSGAALTRVLFTDQNGFTPTIALPAPGIMYPTADAVRPFSEYEITVVARGYYTLRNIKLPIYAGSKIVQPVDMVALPNFPSQPIYPPQPRSGDTADTAVG